MIKRGTISPRQIFFILTMLLTGIYILILPRHLVLVAGVDGWFVLLAGGLVSAIMLFFINRVSRKFPGKTVVEFAPLVLGSFLGRIFGAFLVIYYTFLAAVSLRIFAEMLKSALLPDTPRGLVLTVLIVLVAWIVQNGLEDIARFTELLSPLILLLLVLVLLGNLNHMDLIRLRPVLQTPPLDLLEGVISSLSYFGVIIVLLMLYPYVNAPKKLTTTSLVALFFAVSITVAFFLGTVATFGVYETGRMAWPVIELVKMERIGELLERLEAFFLSLWLSIAFINVSVLSFCAISGWTQLLKLKNYRKLTLIIMGLLLVLSLWPKDLLALLGLYKINFIYGFVVTLVVPLFIMVVSLFHKGEKTNA
ncbi:MAG: endospore germination permease [Clostridia bacterium]|nr:endospore germination permease [Clostridia bacterium]